MSDIPMEETPMSKPPLRIRRMLMLGSATALAFGGLLAPQVSAQSSGSGGVPVNATVNGGGEDPLIIECAWALADPTPTWDDYMNGYTSGDDTPSVKPAKPPCVNPDVGTESRPGQADQTDPATAPVHISVLPNIDDKPNQRYIELWAAVDSVDPDTIVHFKVFHPDGTFKVQVDASNYTEGSNNARCAGPRGMFAAAVATGQIDGQTATNSSVDIHDSLEDWCIQDEKDFYYGAFALSKHQPYGKYRIEATAILPANNGQHVLTYFIEVLPVMHLAKDFRGLNFTDLRAGAHYKISGDLRWLSGGPTLQNQGNAGLTVEMSYTNLCLLVPQSGGSPARDCGPGKRIDYFNGGLGTSIAAVEHREPIPSADTDAAAMATTQGFLPAIDSTLGPRYRTLCPNDLAKVDFSAKTPLTLQRGAYSGNVHLKVVASPLCKTDRGSVYGPPFTDRDVTLETTFDGTTPKDNGYYYVS
jgi:hypothetical protein